MRVQAVHQYIGAGGPCAWPGRRSRAAACTVSTSPHPPWPPDHPLFAGACLPARLQCVVATLQPIPAAGHDVFKDIVMRAFGEQMRQLASQPDPLMPSASSLCAAPPAVVPPPTNLPLGLHRAFTHAALFPTG